MRGAGYDNSLVKDDNRVIRFGEVPASQNPEKGALPRAILANQKTPACVGDDMIC